MSIYPSQMEFFYNAVFALLALLALGLEFTKPSQQKVTATHNYYRFRNNYLLVWSFMMGTCGAGGGGGRWVKTEGAQAWVHEKGGGERVPLQGESPILCQHLFSFY
jgi:hypothetical protein